MAKEKSKTAKPASGEKTPETKADAPKTDKPKTGKKSKAKAKYVGQELTIKLSSGKEYTGLCTAERKTNDGDQVFLKIAGAVSRFFSAKDIAK